MGTLIDSSVLIAWERDQLDLETRLSERADEEFAISAITASELLHGVHRATTAARKTQREAFVEGLMARLPIFSFDQVAARVHASLSAELAKNGTPVGAHDLVIAATAMAHGFGVATRDDRSFPRITGLTLQRW